MSSASGAKGLASGFGTGSGIGTGGWGSVRAGWDSIVATRTPMDATCEDKCSKVVETFLFSSAMERRRTMTVWFMSGAERGGGEGVFLTTVANDGDPEESDGVLFLVDFPFLGRGFDERVSDTMIEKLRKCI